MDASIAASHPEAVCCKHADIGCPAQFFLVEELERHYKEEAQEHLELALRALSVERSMKEHLQEAMTSSFCGVLYLLLICFLRCPIKVPQKRKGNLVSSLENHEATNRYCKGAE